MIGQRRAGRQWKTLWADEDGPTATEYSVLLVLIVFGVFSVLSLIGAFLGEAFTTVSNGLPES